MREKDNHPPPTATETGIKNRLLAAVTDSCNWIIKVTAKLTADVPLDGKTDEMQAFNL